MEDLNKNRLQDAGCGRPEGVAAQAAGEKTGGEVLVEALDASGWEWEVVLIQAGLSGNGSYYPPEVLREATPLFSGVRALARADEEHAQDKQKSVRNIVGWFDRPRYEDGSVLAHFHISEAADWLRRLLVDAWRRGKKDIVGFSLVAKGESRIKRLGKEVVRWVERIRQVELVDVVVNPAAGGRLMRLVASTSYNNESEEKKEEKGMRKEKMATSNQEGYAEAHTQGIEQQLAQLKQELELARSRVCLTEALAESGLPQPAKERLRRQYRDRVVSEPELREVIRQEKEYLARVSGRYGFSPLPASSRAEVGLSEREKVLRALDGFFANRDIDGVPRFRSFRDAYVTITGDVNLTGQLQYASNLSRFTESLTTTSWSEILGDSITRRMLEEYRTPGLDDWRKIVSDITAIRDFRTNRRMRLGGYGILPTVAEQAAYQTLTSPGDEEATYAIEKHGGLEEITLEMIANDDVGAIRRIPQKLGRAAARTLYKTVFDVLATNPITSYDGLNLFDVAHGNLGSDALSATSLLSAKIAMAEQTAFGDAADVLGLTARWLVVPLELEDIAYRLTTSPTIVGATNNAGTEPNIHSSYGLEVIVVPYWTDANDWVLVCDPADCPTIEVGFFNGKEEPELFVQDQPTVGSMFTNDKITYKIRHIYGVCVLDHRGMYKSVVV